MDKQFHPGLENIAVAETRLSRIDGDAGELLIAGYPVDELAPRASYEESLYLLFEDRLPNATELQDFRADLADRRTIADAVYGVLEQAVETDASGMDALRMGAAAASLETVEDTPTADAKRVVAGFPTIVAAYWRIRQGAEPVSPRADLGHAANYLYMLTGEDPTEAAVRGLETYLNAVVDHGLNASTFTARVVVSTESDPISAATAAIGALKGPLHGGAPGPVLEMLRTVHEAADPANWVEKRLSSGERLMGFGHRVYRVRDPRAAVLQTAAESFYDPDDEFFATVQQFEDVAVEALAKHSPDRTLETNVEFYTAVLLDGIGIPKPLFTPTFAVSRVGGWMAHVREQLNDNRLVRPRARYVGATERSWTPIAER